MNACWWVASRYVCVCVLDKSTKEQVGSQRQQQVDLLTCLLVICYYSDQYVNKVLDFFSRLVTERCRDVPRLFLHINQFQILCAVAVALTDFVINLCVKNFSPEQQPVIWTANIWVVQVCPLGIVCRREKDGHLLRAFT